MVGSIYARAFAVTYRRQFKLNEREVELISIPTIMIGSRS